MTAPVSRLKLKPTEPKEHTVQDAILTYLAYDRRVAWARRINSGAHTAESLDAAGRTVRRFVRYGFPGCADILGQLRGCGRFLAVEVKAPAGKATPEQQAFLDQVRAAGGVAILARSVEDVQAGLDAAWKGAT